MIHVICPAFQGVVVHDLTR